MKRLNQQRSVFLVFMMVLVVFFIIGCDQEKPGGAPAAYVPEVGVIEVTPERLVLTTELPGRTVAFRTAEIRPQVSGLLLKRLFTEGKNVKKGQMLYQVDPSSFRAAVDSAKAGHAAAQTAVGRARAAQEAAAADMARLKANLELAQTNRDRYEALFEKKVLSAFQRDQAVTEARAAQEAWQSAKAQLEISKNAVSEAQAAVQQAAAALKTARINLSHTTITAPIPGRIGRSKVTEGAIVTAYQAMAMATIQQMDPIYVDVPQSTTELLRLRKRLEQGSINRDSRTVDEVALILEDGSRYPTGGTLEFQDITVDTSTGSVILRAVFPNPDNILLPGMFVRAVIREGVNESAILIPQQAVFRDTRGSAMVMVVDQKNIVNTKMVTIDRAVKDRWLISSGLSKGERLIVQGIQKVRPGATVKPVPVSFAKTEKSPGEPEKGREEGDR